jgi:hypothetical protein
MRYAGHVREGGKRGAYMVLVGKSEGNILLGRTTRRWEDNIKTYIQEICLEWDVDGIDLAEDKDR